MGATELAAFFASLKLVFRSGIAIGEGLEILMKNTTGAHERARLEVLRKATSEALPFNEALRRMGGVPDYALALITIAVETGRMDSTMESLQIYYEKRDALSQRARSAVVYPLSMLLMVFLVVVVMLTKVVPVFEQVFSQLGFSMTGLAGALRDLGDVFSRYALWFCVLLLLLAAAALFMRFNPTGRGWARKLFETSPPTRKLATRLSVQRFALAMSSMLSCGVAWDTALDLARPLMGNAGIAERVAVIQQTMQKGGSFQSALEASGLFPGSAMALLSMGIQTGTDSDAFLLIGESITAETEGQMDRLVAAIEPTMVGIMCVLVGMVLLSVMLPIIGILASM
jgi:type IV pilus assembly protein PilC